MMCKLNLNFRWNMNGKGASDDYIVKCRFVIDCMSGFSPPLPELFYIDYKA